MTEQDNLQRQADRSKPRGGRSVLFYLFVLFAAALVLLLLAYFMQQRANEAARSDLEQSSHTAEQSVEQLSEENDALREQIANLENESEYWHDQLIQTTDTLEKLGVSYEQTQRFYVFVKALYTAEVLVSQQQYADAAALFENWDAGSYRHLDEVIQEYTEENQSDSIAIEARFQELVSTLQSQGFLLDLEIGDSNNAE